MAFYRSLSDEKVYEVSVPPPDLKVRQKTLPLLSLDEQEAMRHLFEEKRFDELNRTLETLQAAFERDPLQEQRVTSAFWLFDTVRKEERPLFDAWVKAFPEHFAPYLARAEYYCQQGWEARGAEYASKTSEEKFRDMRRDFDAADRDLDAALERNSHLLSAYLIRIQIYTAEGMSAEADQVFEKGLARCPGSYLLYRRMLWAKLPRWGGSYPEMEALAKSANQSAGSTPEMPSLFGKIYLDQAQLLRYNKSYAQALALDNKALKYGENGFFYEERARTYWDMNDYKQALADFNRSITLRPLADTPLRLRAYIDVDLKDPKGAKRDIDRAELLDPGSPKILRWRKWASAHYLHLGHKVFKSDLSQAIADYGTALELDPACAAALYWRGVAYYQRGRFDLALADLRQAIEDDPGNFKACRMIDYLLARDRKWDEILAYWDRYLAQDPDNAAAYLERAGTYRQKGDMAKAIADLKQSCSLGNQKACKIYQKYR